MTFSKSVGAGLACAALCCGCGQKHHGGGGGEGGEGNRGATGGAAGETPDIPGHTPSAARSCASDPRCRGESCCASLDVTGGELAMGRGTEDCGPPSCQTEGWNIACPLEYYCDSSDLPEHMVPQVESSKL